MSKKRMNDKIRVVKKDGTRSEELEALVTTDKIISYRVDVVVEAGDTIERYLSNGAVEKYVVIKPCFHEKFGSIDANYQMRVRDLTATKDKKSPSSVTYNVQGDNTRIVSDSTDSSINLNMKNSKIQLEAIEKMRELLTLSDLSDKQKGEAKALVEELDSRVKANSDNKTIERILEKLMKFVPLASFIKSLW